MMKKKGRPEKTNPPVLVVICRWLLVLESVEFFLLGVYHFHLNRGPQLFSMLFARWLRGETALTLAAVQKFVAELVDNAASAQLLVALNESGILFILTILALWSAIGFFRLWRIAWTAAIFVQVGALLTSLILYFVNKPVHITFMMISGIFMVFYLNYADVHTFFNAHADLNERGR